MSAPEPTQENGFVHGRPADRPALGMDGLVESVINKIPMATRLYPDVYSWQVAEAVFDWMVDAGLVERCHYCGTMLIGRVVKTKDHIVPRSRGGLDASYNLVPACQPCNGRKSNDWPDEQHCVICTEAVRRFRTYIGMLPVRDATIKSVIIPKTPQMVESTHPDIIDVNNPKEK